MARFIHIIEKWKCSGKNKNMNSRQEAKQPNDFSLVLVRQQRLVRIHYSGVRFA